LGVVAYLNHIIDKELSLVRWNDKAPKYDIREWSPDHSKMGKGVTLTAELYSSFIVNRAR